MSWTRKKTPKKPIDLNNPPENYDHKRFHVWLTKKGFKHNHSPNGGYRPGYSGFHFKLMGTSKGFPDFEVPYPCGGYHGFYLELKRKIGGTLEPEQKEWLDYLSSVGYYAVDAHGFDEAKKHFEYYLSLMPKAA